MIRGVCVVLILAASLAGCVEDGADDRDPPTAPADDNRVSRYGGPSAGLTNDAVANLTTQSVLTGFQGGEPTIGVLPSGVIFMQAWGDTIRSADGGETWESVYEYTYEALGATYPSGDPMLWVDDETDRVYWNHLRPHAAGYPATNELRLRCTSIGWSQDEGGTWERNDRACGANGVDFQKLSGGPPGPEPNPLAGVEYPSVLYLCYNKQLPALGTYDPHCSVSYDGGATWPVENRALTADTDDGLPYVGGSAGWPSVAPDGTVYLAGTTRLAVSSDSGLSWRAIEGPPDMETWDIEFTADGTMYALGTRTDEAHLARSVDGGATWDGPWRVAPPDVMYTIHLFSALEAADEGRIAVAFVGTTDAVENHNDAPDETQWHLHLVVSEDAHEAEPSFTSMRATDDPVQIGSICLGRAGGCGGAEDRNLLDFIHADTGPNGTFYVAYADGCTDQCAADPDAATPDDSRDDATAMAWLEGWSLRDAQ